MNTIVIQCKYKHHPIRISLISRYAGNCLLFFIHGLGCAKESFLDAFDQPSLSTYSIAAIDLPGFGESPAIDNFPYTMDNYAHVCREVLAQLPHERIHIAGHSMGGAIAVLLADEIPDRVASLMNIEGNLIGSDCTTSRRTVSVTYDNFRKRLMRELILTARGSEETGMRLWAQWSAKSDPLAFTKSSRSLVEWSDSGELLHRFLALPCRKAYFFGERNRTMPVISRLGPVPAITISRSGHFPMNDNPAEFYAKLAAALDDDSS